jgi:hypothetical protein
VLASLAQSRLPLFAARHDALASAHRHSERVKRYSCCSSPRHECGGGATHYRPGPNNNETPLKVLTIPIHLVLRYFYEVCVQMRAFESQGTQGIQWATAVGGTSLVAHPALLPVASEFGEKNREGKLRVCYSLAKPRCIGGSGGSWIIDKYSYATLKSGRPSVKINGEQVDFFQVVVLSHAALWSGAHNVTEPPIKLEHLRLFKGAKQVHPWMLCHGCGRSSFGGVLKPGCVSFEVVLFFWAGIKLKVFLKSFFRSIFFSFFLSFFFFQVLFFSSHPTSPFPHRKTQKKNRFAPTTGTLGSTKRTRKMPSSTTTSGRLRRRPSTS